MLYRNPPKWAHFTLSFILRNAGTSETETVVQVRPKWVVHLLRNTHSEAKLWSLLKGSQLEDRKFRRQHSVGSYVLDFYCPSERLCIELDGDSHYEEMNFAYDKARTDFLNSLKIRVLRFKNNEIGESLEWVLGEIRRSFIRRTTPAPP